MRFDSASINPPIRCPEERRSGGRLDSAWPQVAWIALHAILAQSYPSIDSSHGVLHDLRRRLPRRVRGLVGDILLFDLWSRE